MSTSGHLQLGACGSSSILQQRAEPSSPTGLSWPGHSSRPVLEPPSPFSLFPPVPVWQTMHAMRCLIGRRKSIGIVVMATLEKLYLRRTYICFFQPALQRLG